MALSERHYQEELTNIIDHEPMFVGNAISHATVKELEDRGWVARLHGGDLISTPLGRRNWRPRRWEL